MIEATGVTVRVGPACLLDEADFGAQEGRVTAILGPNGAGKTTLLRTLTGSLVPDAGDILFGGVPVADWPRRELAQRRAILSQRTDLTFPFTVFEVVLLGRSPYAGQTSQRLDSGIALETMTECGVAHLADRAYPTLSGGEQQRVQLARVLAQIRGNGDGEETRPGSCLFLDEPTSSLDIAHQHAILRLARDLAARGTTVVAVLHDLNLAAQFADEVCLMKAGRIVERGAPAHAIRPDIVEQVFDIAVRVVAHPDTQGTYVVPAMASRETAGT